MRRPHLVTNDALHFEARLEYTEEHAEGGIVGHPVQVATSQMVLSHHII